MLIYTKKKKSQNINLQRRALEMLPDTTNPVTFFCYLGEGGVCTNILRYLMISPLLYLTFASTLMSDIHVIFSYF